MIAIVDSGGANLSSVVNAFEKMGLPATLTGDPDIIARSPKVILPGVGAAGAAMAALEKNGLLACLRGLKQPVLGICLGMQILFESSEEGATPCLGVIPGKVERLRAPGLAVPHMGWNEVAHDGSCPLFRGIPNGAFFYFFHSYRAAEGAWVKARCEYGEAVPAAVERGNFFGVQFHPERSSKAGARLLENFLAL